MAGRNFISEWRKYRGRTQESLAEEIGINRVHLSDIERGKNRYNQTHLENIAEALGCTPADLLTGLPTKEDDAAQIENLRLKLIDAKKLVLEVAKKKSNVISDADFIATMITNVAVGAISKEALEDAFEFYSLGKKS